MESRLKIWAIKNRRGKIARIVREQYLRDDIPCQIEGCSACTKESKEDTLFPKPIFKTNQTPVLLIPALDVALNYLELLESNTLDNIIFFKVITNEVRHESLRAYTRIR
jgi:hypothetical protein